MYCENQKPCASFGRRSVLFLSLAAAMGGFLFGFDTAVINGGEQQIQSVWNLSSFVHGLVMSSALWGTVIGAMCGGKMKSMPLTVGSFKTEDGRLCAFVTEGEATDDKIEKEFFGVGFVFRKADGDANAMLNYMAKNGYRHHVAFVRGSWSAAIVEAFSNYLGYDVERI